ncbi:hypothetical protein [Lysinibacillus sphaericus]|uniref:Uncharacterized protein n=1 Tax=Lysinibacillus sphaericus OT4b.31 TaxID=1285586 RepID=R7Z7V1_LYSSH|nr:hypothetical protein [Lysinibacillus sphaericus]EON70183.1 hypothetical protein H131_22741 [Lysinibacillus sphaericus OT4b.31]
MIQTSKFLAFIDMNTLEVIHAEEINNPNYFSFIGGNWFADSKYLYVRGITAASGSGSVCYAVMDKTTFKYVTVIRQNGGSSFGDNDALVGDIVCQGSYFFLSSNTYIYLWVFQLAFDGLGVPTNFAYVTLAHWAGGELSPPAKAFFGDDKFIYVIYTNHSSLYTIEKKQFVPSNKPFNNVAGNSIVGSSPGGFSQWNYKYSENGKNFILLSFGSSNNASISVMNIDTLALHQQLATNQADSFLTFDYQTGKQIYTQPYTVAGYELNGNGYDNLLRFIREGETWIRELYYVPALKALNGTSMTRQFTLGTFAYIKDEDLYLKVHSRLFAKLGDANIISHYKEVID